MRAELQHFPNDPVANCILGQILLNNSQLEEAESRFRAALKANPHYREALFGLGKTEIARNEPAAAIAPLRKAVQLDPNYAEAAFRFRDGVAGVRSYGRRRAGAENLVGAAGKKVWRRRLKLGTATESGNL